MSRENARALEFGNACTKGQIYRITAMATCSFRNPSLALHGLSQRTTILAKNVPRYVSPSIRLKSTDVPRAAKDSLPWSEYLAIRRSKRKWEIVSFYLCRPTWCLTLGDWGFHLSGVDGTMRAGRFGGWCGLLWIDGIRRNEAYHGATAPCRPHNVPFTSLQGIDPLLFFGGATLGCMGTYPLSSLQLTRSRPFLYLGAGYLVGPIIGSTLWRVTHRRAMALIEARDREFHQHIVRNRVDPTAQSATNPVPDFYGDAALSLVL
jgi:mitochondrial import inner membrane translocase subunit TIM23